MNIDLHILNKSGFLNKYLDILRESFDKHLEKIKAKIPVKDVDVILFEQRDDLYNGAQVNPETGIGGSTGGEHLSYIVINSAHKEIQSNIEENAFLCMLAHELYHTVRWHFFSLAPGKNLLDTLIVEGLSSHFEEEIAGISADRQYYDFMTPAKFNVVMYKAERELYNTQYDHSKWFFGSNKEIPMWSGYNLGYILVKGYLAQHPDEKPSTLYKVPSQKFWDSYKSLQNTTPPTSLQPNGTIFE